MTYGDPILFTATVRYSCGAYCARILKENVTASSTCSPEAAVRTAVDKLVARRLLAGCQRQLISNKSDITVSTWTITLRPVLDVFTTGGTGATQGRT
jgi:hypothetical protein